MGQRIKEEKIKAINYQFIDAGGISRTAQQDKLGASGKGGGGTPLSNKECTAARSLCWTYVVRCKRKLLKLLTPPRWVALQSDRFGEIKIAKACSPKPFDFGTSGRVGLKC